MEVAVDPDQTEPARSPLCTGHLRGTARGAENGRTTEECSSTGCTDIS